MGFAIVAPLGWTGLGIWIAALGTLGVYSILFGENKLSRFFEHVFLAAGGAYAIVITITDVLKPLWWDPMLSGFRAAGGDRAAGSPWQALWILALVLGSFWYFTYSRRYNWLSRLVVGIAMGAEAGMVFKNQFGQYVPQIRDSFKPLWTGAWLTSLNNTLYVFTLICVMLYFFFAFERKNKAVEGGANIGRWLLMICFGAMFGNTVMARVSLFLERFGFLVFDWLGISPR